MIKSVGNQKNREDSSIKLEELEETLKMIKTGRSAGNDNINSELYKNAPREFTWRLLNFLNKIYIESTIPNEWKEAIVIPIFKKVDKNSTPKRVYLNKMA
jgi:hypothetical protein